MVEVLPIETPTLGDRSYLAHDGDTALVIDPQRDIDRVSSLVAQLGVRITHVAETHMHNDYVTGGLALAQAAGASYLVNAADPVRFDRTPVRDGDCLPIGGAMRLRVLATPGHTFTHLSYVLEADGEVAGVFTGGALLFGPAGRICSDRTAPLPLPARSTPRPSGWPVSCPTPRRSSRRTGSAASAPPRRRRPCRPRSGGRSNSIPRSPPASNCMWRRCSLGWTPGPPTTRTWARPILPVQPARTCPSRAGPTRRRYAGGSRPASG